MQNYVAPGEVLTLTTPGAGVVSGTACRVGSLVVVPTITVTAAQVTADATIKFTAIVVGVVEVTRVHTGGTGWTEGCKVYWDDSAKTFTKAVISDSGDALVGVAAKATGDTDLTGWLRLDGVVR
jgi:predicted RecA/RadA family phage recombinase